MPHTLMKTDYLWMAATALLWGAYPLVTRTTGYDGPRAALILMLVGLVPVSILSYLQSEAGWPDRPGLIKLVIAGLMMGVGLIAFIRVANGALDASVSIPIVDVAMLLVTAIGAMVFFAEAVTVQKVAGIVLLVAGIGLLRPS
jgi:drug/metabolite transporter (DMT)-like permease